ncbi:MAG: hypothetical protein AAFX85_10785, partial [Pseudomonadota bacterium]
PPKIGASLHEKVNVPLSEVPAAVLQVIKAAHPAFEMREAEKEIKHGNTYFDIEGVDGNGNDIEFDTLLQGDGSWRIAEIQRDLSFGQLPEPVAKLYQSRREGVPPRRIIESDQGDGTTIYEFYTLEDGQEHKYEIRLDVAFLEEEWTH